MPLPDLEHLHPRPLLVREGWRDLCGEWQLAFDDDDRGLDDGWADRSDPFDRRVTVPFPPEAKCSGVGDRSHHPVLWYRTPLAVPPLAPGQRLVVHFGAVDYRATVWVDGQHVAEHVGGHTPFSVDVTAAVAGGGEHHLVVRAEDRSDDPRQPRGKQDWLSEPHAIWYHRTSGIWQPVFAEVLSDEHITRLAWTPDLGTASVRLELELSRAPREPRSLHVTLRLGDDVLAAEAIRVSSDHVALDIAIPALRHGQHLGHLLWSPESPTLVEADLSLRESLLPVAADAPGRTLDTVASYVGLRSAGFRDGRFLLNGKPYYLRMALEQGYWPESHLAAPDTAALRREVGLAKDLGFNGLRLHQKVEDPRFLHLCDRLGLLVWGEMAGAYEFGETAIRRTTTEWLAAVRRDRSHPCIVTWVPHNESWGIPQAATSAAQQHFASALYHLTKAVDPSRPVISNDGWEHTVSDIWSVHDYDPRAGSLRERYGSPAAVASMLRGSGPGRRKVLLVDGDERGQPVVISEFGGLAYLPEAGQEWFGYGVVGSAEALLDRFRELVDALLDCEDLAGFCYTQLTDTEQERNGLLTEDREPKLPVDAVREIVTRPSRAVPAEAVDADRRRARS